MKNTLVAALAAAAIIVVLNAQDTAPVPYVASVKKNAGGFGAQMRIAPGTISANGVPVRLLMRQAFGQLQDFQLVGGPDWIGNTRYDIVAKMEGDPPSVRPGTGADHMMLATRTLLADRFKLKVHKETRELDIYALTMAKPGGKPGPKLIPARGGYSPDEIAARRGAPPPAVPG